MRALAGALVVTVALAVVFCPPASAAPAASQPAQVTAPVEVVEHVRTGDDTLVAKLSNGMTVIVKATRSSPVVCVRALVRAGGLYEREWMGCGISHLTEHLVAEEAEQEKAAKTQPAEEARSLSARTTKIGGQSNAWTSLDSTVYVISAAASKTMECIDLIADWVARQGITREAFEREHGVVQRELELDKDDPEEQMWYAHAPGIFGTHPAAVPIIGFQDPLGKVKYEDVLAYRARMYVPQNMVFVVVGDVDVQAVLKRICRDFAGFDHGRAVDLSLPEVKPIAGVRRVVRPHAALKEAAQDMSFLAVDALHEDAPALDLLSAILGEGYSGRLVKTVQRKAQLVTKISCESWTPTWGRGAFSVSFRADPGKANAAEKAVLDELKAAMSEGVTAEELTRAKRGKLAQLVHSQQTVDSIADRLGSDYLYTGDVAFSKQYLRKVQAVTAEQVQRAARKYFTFDRMAITRMVPGSEAPAATTGPAGGPKSSTSAFTLPNGLRVVLSPDESVGLVSMVFACKGGLMLEDVKTNGLGTLMARLSTRGAGKLTAEQIDEFFDEAGGSISENCNRDNFTWQATVLDDRYRKALEILADVVLRPTFDPNELEIDRSGAVAAIDRVEEDWYWQLMGFFREKFFTDSPYQMLPTGRKEVVRSATVKQIAEHHRSSIKAGSSVLTVYGHFDAPPVRKAVEQLFADVPKGSVELKIPAARQVDKPGEWYVLTTKNKGAAVSVAAPGVRIDNLEDRFPLDVLDTILTGWELPAGWLWDELRGKQLAYDVEGSNMVGLAPGAFHALAACQPEKAQEVAEIIKRILVKASSYEPTQEKIDETVNSILTVELLDNQSVSALAMRAATDELYGFGYDFHGKLESYYRKVRPADVLRVAKKYLTGGYVVSITTPNPELLKKGEEPKK